MLTALATSIWVFVHHEHRVIKAAQPYFLYMLSLGSGVIVCSIVPLSFDESDGWSGESLGRACMAIPWLFSIGYILIYGALLSKLWRVQRVLQFARHKVDIRQVIWPSIIFVLLALIVLSLWTALSPLEWERTETNAVTGESIGKCSSEHIMSFVAPLIIIMLIPTILTLVLAWKTKDVDDVYSETKWIFTMILVQLELTLFAVPMFALLRDVSTDARLVGYSLLIWTFPMATIGLIIGPKGLAFYQQNSATKKRGGSHGEVHVTGLAPGLEGNIPMSVRVRPIEEISGTNAHRTSSEAALSLASGEELPTLDPLLSE